MPERRDHPDTNIPLVSVQREPLSLEDGCFSFICTSLKLANLDSALRILPRPLLPHLGYRDTGVDIRQLRLRRLQPRSQRRHDPPLESRVLEHDLLKALFTAVTEEVFARGRGQDVPDLWVLLVGDDAFRSGGGIATGCLCRREEMSQAG